MKNYRINFMDKTYINLTAEQAAKAIGVWNSGEKIIVLDSSAYASHQICSVERIKGQELKDLCEREGIEIKNAPRIEQFISDKKLLA